MIHTILISDTATSISHLEFALLDMIGRWAWANNHPFGGVSIVMEGDPRSIQIHALDSSDWRGESHRKRKPLYRSKVWKTMVEEHRISFVRASRRSIQLKSELDWQNVLGQIRKATHSSDLKALEILAESNNATEDEMQVHADALLYIVKTNQEAEAKNEECFRNYDDSHSRYKSRLLPSSEAKEEEGGDSEHAFEFLKETQYKYRVMGHVKRGRQISDAPAEVTPNEIAALIQMNRGVVDSDMIVLRAGIPVIHNLFRTSVRLGVVTGFTVPSIRSESFPIVRWADGSALTETISRQNKDVFSPKRKGWITLSFLPLRHAYAISLSQLIGIRLPPLSPVSTSDGGGKQENHWWVIRVAPELLQMSRNVAYFILSRVCERKQVFMHGSIQALPDWDLHTPTNEEFNEGGKREEDPIATDVVSEMGEREEGEEESTTTILAATDPEAVEEEEEQKTVEDVHSRDAELDPTESKEEEYVPVNKDSERISEENREEHDLATDVRHGPPPSLSENKEEEEERTGDSIEPFIEDEDQKEQPVEDPVPLVSTVSIVTEPVTDTNKRKRKRLIRSASEEEEVAVETQEVQVESAPTNPLEEVLPVVESKNGDTQMEPSPPADTNLPASSTSIETQPNNSLSAVTDTDRVKAELDKFLLENHERAKELTWRQVKTELCSRLGLSDLGPWKEMITERVHQYSVT